MDGETRGHVLRACAAVEWGHALALGAIPIRMHPCPRGRFGVGRPLHTAAQPRPLDLAPRHQLPRAVNTGDAHWCCAASLSTATCSSWQTPHGHGHRHLVHRAAMPGALARGSRIRTGPSDERCGNPQRIAAEHALQCGAGRCFWGVMGASAP